MMHTVLDFFGGKRDAVREMLQQRMEQAAQALDFEQAAVLRDGIRSIDRISEQQDAVSTREEDKQGMALTAGAINFIMRGIAGGAVVHFAVF